ncbi:vomeronasal type-2 receptor 26-like [Protopterus annectens]|uniref:vomeronasal type-2 receptor 26-like n=1 Tax=Protopterus annectens TaxID=7888 RepID=UPI001CFA2A69|nr:vomeronasal type-2 receptor 26-like [Protopterus annectens]
MTHIHLPAYGAAETDVIVSHLVQHYEQLFRQTAPDQQKRTALWNELVHRVSDVELYNRSYEQVRHHCSDLLCHVRQRAAAIPKSVCTESCSAGYRKAMHDGQPSCCFYCIRCADGEISNQTDSNECISCHEDHWPNEAQTRCIPRVKEFFSFIEPLGIVTTVISVCSSLFTVSVLVVFVWYHGTPIVKANNRELSYLLLLALILCFLCPLIFIGQPDTVNCILRQTTFGIIFAMCVSCVLAKTVMVVMAFNAKKPNSSLRKWVGPKLCYVIVITGTSVQVILCCTWLAISPPFPEYNRMLYPGKIIIECNEGSSAAFWCMLGYLSLLAHISFALAFLSRNLPDSFNEAKFITFSMFAFVSVWISFIPAYLSTRGRYMVVVEIFAILCSSSGLLICIFAPKCYILLLRTDLNTKEYLMGRAIVNKKT